MNYFLRIWSYNTEIVNPDGDVLNLQEQYEFLEKKVDVFNITDRDERKLANSLRKELYGESNYLETPSDVSEILMLVNNRIDLGYYKNCNAEEKGKLLAALAFKSRTESVERFFQINERRRKDAIKGK